MGPTHTSMETPTKETGVTTSDTGKGLTRTPALESRSATKDHCVHFTLVPSCIGLPSILQLQSAVTIILVSIIAFIRNFSLD